MQSKNYFKVGVSYRFWYVNRRREASGAQRSGNENSLSCGHGCSCFCFDFRSHGSKIYKFTRVESYHNTGTDSRRYRLSCAGLKKLQGLRPSWPTSASGLWVTAGIGMAAGFGMLPFALVATVLVLMIFILMNILEKPIRKISDEIDHPKNS